MAVAIATYLSTSETVVTEVRHGLISSVVRKAAWCGDHVCECEPWKARITEKGGMDYGYLAAPQRVRI
jgi:hypothetical protein